MIVDVEVCHAHMFCGLGGGAKGFNKGQARVGQLRAKFRCLGGIDRDAAGLRDFHRLAGVPGTLLDLFSRDQFIAFNGKEPPAGWREATPDDIRRAYGNEHPHIMFLSAPCKGFSGLLAERQAKTAKYQALNGLTLRGVWLALEAYKDDPIELFVFENVPRIATRGRHLLDQIVALLRSYGYAVAETTHDCGELGGLAQSRKRFLLVARHQAKVPAFLYEPAKHRLRGVGEVLERLPLPGMGGGPMHRMPALQWQTWVRLALVEAGSDWRSLNRLRIEDGFLADLGIVPESPLRNEAFNVKRWDQRANAVTSKNQPSSGATAVADPRMDEHPRFNSVQLGVKPWHEPFGTVTGQTKVGGGNNAVADPRILDRTPFNDVYRVVEWTRESPAVTAAGGAMAAVADPRPPQREDYKATKYKVTPFDAPSGAVIGASTTGNGAFAVADPRHLNWADSAHRNKERVIAFDQPAGTVTGKSQVGSGALSVADPRPHFARGNRDEYKTQGHYGVLPWSDPSGGVTASGQHDNGRWSVADPRALSGGLLEGSPESGDQAHLGYSLPQGTERLVAYIRALDGTWHRPITTLELAALQSLVDPDEFLELDGLSDSAWRERIGNAVPPESAQAIASVMGRALLSSMTGQTFILSNEPIWVRPIALALAVRQEGDRP